eukprot:scaffold135409_cov33-Tisochrysis_lutea.AAC.1
MKSDGSHRNCDIRGGMNIVKRSIVRTSTCCSTAMPEICGIMAAPECRSTAPRPSLMPRVS